MSCETNHSAPLVLRGVSASYGAQPVIALESWRVEAGEAALVMGPSGCGKTTLLSLLCGLHAPDSGQVCFGETDLYALSPRQRDAFRGQHIGVLFQQFHLVKPFTVRQNLQIALSLAGRAADEACIDGLLAALNLSPLANAKAGSLSVGEAQRVAVARAVIGKPAWLLCDEPTSALDDTNCAAMLELLRESAAQCNAALIIVTHDARVRSALPKASVLELPKMVRATP